jgi:small subunit ribosomal protein S6
VSDLRRYETVFILRPDLGEARTAETIGRMEGVVNSAGGELLESDRWGVRGMAYRIRGQERGHYLRLDYLGEAATMNELERNLKLADDVLRFLSVLVEPSPDIAKLRAEANLRRERAAQAKAADRPAAAGQTGAEPQSGPAPEAAEEALATEKPATQSPEQAPAEPEDEI